MKPQPPYIGFHFVVRQGDYDSVADDGRYFQALSGELLPTKDRVREAMKRDGVVLSCRVPVAAGGQ